MGPQGSHPSDTIAAGTNVGADTAAVTGADAGATPERVAPANPAGRPDVRVVPDPGVADGAEPGSDVTAGEDATAEAMPDPAGADHAMPDDPVSRARAELAEAVAQRDGYLEDLQRVTAEFANYRRQTIKRNTEVVAQATSRLAEALLPVLDACEAAEAQGVQGIEAVRSQLLSVLGAEGLAVVGEVGEPFDPTRHEAVTAESPADGAETAEQAVVAEVFRTGYALKNRVLRPAMVKVRG